MVAAWMFASCCHRFAAICPSGTWILLAHARSYVLSPLRGYSDWPSAHNQMLPNGSHRADEADRWFSLLATHTSFQLAGAIEPMENTVVHRGKDASGAFVACKEAI
jgi:hypothetical protein